jgi:hypothetical protein
VDEVKAMAARKAYQNIKQGSFESLAQYSERFRETYRAFQDSTSTNVSVEEADQAMDFFYGLDPVKYGIFKTNMINGWTTGAFRPPTTVNEIYRVAGNWVKPTSKLEGGTAATYVTIEEDAAIKRRKEQTEKNKKKSAASGKEIDEQATKKDRSQLECWYCKEKGHFSSKCPKRKKDKEAKDGEAQAHATWQELEHSMFCTVCEVTVNNAVNATQKLKPNEVLLDNQADVSIVHPVLLENVRPAEKVIKVKGVGGIQMIVDQVGDLPGFFQVYASAQTKANVLSFADVEDLYEISYVQKEAFVVHMPTGDLVFSRRDKLYVAELYEAEERIVQATVRENEALYTKAEV